MNRLLLALLALPVAAAASPAHPLPNLRYDRTVHVRLERGGVSVDYALELNDWTMLLDGKNLLTPEQLKDAGTQTGFAKLYAEKKPRYMAESLRATLDGRPLEFRPVKAEVERERDHLRFRVRFHADWRPTGAKQAFAFEDQNFENRAGKITLILDRPGAGVELIESDEPFDLRGVSPLDYKPGDEKRARQVSAVFEVADAASAPAAAPAPAEPTAEPPVEVTQADADLFDDVRHRGLTALFDSGLGVGVMLLLAAAFGMAHAFTPGHGKTMVAAYLVGERGTVTHATVLGLVSTIAHTGSVILLAIVIYFAYGNEPPAAAQGWLTLAGGLLIAVVGLWLLLQRVRGHADHVHLFTGHHHHHSEGEKGRKGEEEKKTGEVSVSSSPPLPVSSSSGAGWLRVVLLGLGGGIIPCWDAVLLFLVALTRGRVGLAIPLLLAFSAGLAAVLIGLGVGVVYANRAGGRRFGERKWFKFLPVFSAALLVALGVWFVRDGWQFLVAAARP